MTPPHELGPRDGPAAPARHLDGGQLFSPAPSEVLTHLALALTRHIRQLRHDGLRVPASIDELAAILMHCVRTRPAPTGLDDMPLAADDGGVAGRLLVTKAEAAELLGVSVRTVERLVAAGRLPLLHIEGAARIRIADIEAYVDSLVSSQATPRPLDDEPEGSRS